MRRLILITLTLILPAIGAFFGFVCVAVPFHGLSANAGATLRGLFGLIGVGLTILPLLAFDKGTKTL
jgi:hypothetical protein